jgi:hypothetical protein
LPLLQPHMLGDAASAAITHFQSAGESENTRRTYRQALRYWLALFQVRYWQELKLPVHVASLFEEAGAKIVAVQDHSGTRFTAKGLRAADVSGLEGVPRRS